MRGGEIFDAKAQPVHAAVELQPDDEAMRAGELLQRIELFGRVNDDLTLFLGRERELLDAEHAFEQQDALSYASFTKRDSIGEASHTQTIGVRERASDTNHSMAVAIRFDDSNDARARRHPPHHCQITAQCRRIDGRNREAHA